MEAGLPGSPEFLGPVDPVGGQGVGALVEAPPHCLELQHPTFLRERAKTAFKVRLDLQPAEPPSTSPISDGRHVVAQYPRAAGGHSQASQQAETRAAPRGLCHLGPGPVWEGDRDRGEAGRRAAGGIVASQDSPSPRDVGPALCQGA